MLRLCTPSDYTISQLKRIRKSLIALQDTFLRLRRNPDFAGNQLLHEWCTQCLNYWRCIEIPVCLAALKASSRYSFKMLDIGSPKLAALWVAENFSFEQVLATDISTYFVQDLEQITNALAVPKLSCAVADAVDLPYPNESISAVLSISVMEHISEHGDTTALKEVSRALVPGGVAVISVPTWYTSLEESIERGELYWEPHTSQLEDRVFYQRRYTLRDIVDRLVDPAGLTVEQFYLIGERPATPHWGSTRNGQLIENWQYLLNTRLASLCSQFAGLYPRLPQLLHHRYSERYHYFCENEDDPHALAAVLVLRKSP